MSSSNYYIITFTQYGVDDKKVAVYVRPNSEQKIGFDFTANKKEAVGYPIYALALKVKNNLEKYLTDNNFVLNDGLFIVKDEDLASLNILNVR